MRKVLCKQRAERDFFRLLKDIHEKPTVNTALHDERLSIFYENQEQNTKVCSYIIYLPISGASGQAS